MSKTSTFLCQERCDRKYIFQSAGQLAESKKEYSFLFAIVRRSQKNCQSRQEKNTCQLQFSRVGNWKQMRPMRMVQLEQTREAPDEAEAMMHRKG